MNEVIIYLGEGRIESGFRGVNIEFKQRGEKQSVNQCSLSPVPELRDLLNQWQLLYPIALNTPQSAPNFGIENDRLLSPIANVGVFDDNTILNSSTQDIEELKDSLKLAIDNWLEQGSFRQIINEIRAVLVPQDLIVVTIVSEQKNIWQLPWHFWDLFKAYPHAVEVFSQPNFKNVTDVKPQRNSKLNILGVFGRDPNLELSSGFLPNLPEVNAKILGLPGSERPSLRGIGDTLAEFFDIFIFYGHGDTQENNTNLRGFVYLDNDTPIEIKRLRDKVKIAVDRGLQIAIFNCCSGLGLADRLSDVNLPYIIVMREQIPNQLAQSFLTDLLRSYSQGLSFPEAFGAARSQMILSEDNFAHFADWLPVLFHNPLSHHVTWQDLCQPAVSIPVPQQVVEVCSYLNQPKRRIWTGVGISLLVSILALSIQSTPSIAGLENWAIDRVQAIQASQIAPGTSKVTIINDVSLFGMSTQADAEPLARQIEDLSAKFKPLMWVVVEDFSNNVEQLNRSNLVLGCTRRIKSLEEAKYLQSELDCNNASETLKIYSQQLSQQGIRLNRHLLTKINSIDLKQPLNLNEIQDLPVSRIKELLTDKIIVVGIPSGTQSIDSMLNRDALALDYLTRAADSRYQFPLVDYWDDGVKLLWIFFWCITIAIATWKLKWQLLVPSIAIAIGISMALFFFSLGIPTVVSAMAMVLVGGTIFSIKQIARRRGSG
ncbi:MAG: hypothetical protein LH613_13555 [Chamaesiphon sp.]|nr:hypothetical protein [Chamaesiphon sp.]